MINVSGPEPSKKYFLRSGSVLAQIYPRIFAKWKWFSRKESDLVCFVSFIMAPPGP